MKLKMYESNSFSS